MLFKGVVLGFVLCKAFDYAKEIISLNIRAKSLRDEGKIVTIDYITLDMRVMEKEEKEVKETVGFVYPKNLQTF